jgi:hypothetical protein
MDDETPQDQLAILRAQIDQSVALAPELARMAYGQFHAFVGEGFTADQALYLTACSLSQSPGEAPS